MAEWLLRNAKSWNKTIILNADKDLFSQTDYGNLALKALTAKQYLFS